MDKSRNMPLIILSYLMVYLIWGSTYLFIAFAVETIPAPWVMAVRFLSSGILFMLIPLVAGKIKRFPSKTEIFASCFLGLFLIIFGNGIITWAEKSVNSHMAALLVSTVPIIVALYNLFLYKSKLAAVQIVGMFCGLGGVALLLLNGKDGGFSLTPAIALIIVAVFSWAFGTAFSRKLKPHDDIVFHTGMQMFFAGIICWPVAFLSSGSPLPPVIGTTFFSWVSVFYLAFIGGSAIIAYNYLLKQEPTSRLTTYAFVNPLVATLLGILIRRENGAVFLIPGMVLIFLGLFFILYLGKDKKTISKKEHS